MRVRVAQAHQRRGDDAHSTSDLLVEVGDQTNSKAFRKRGCLAAKFSESPYRDFFPFLEFETH